MTTTKVKAVYIGLFEVNVSEDMKIETILVGFRDGEVRATIEHEESAVPGLIELCNDLASSQNMKWRLVKCTNFEDINLKDYDEINQSDFKNIGGTLWNL